MLNIYCYFAYLGKNKHSATENKMFSCSVLCWRNLLLVNIYTPTL